MESGWVQDGTKAIGLLSLIQIVSVPSVVKISSGLYQGGDQKIGKAGKQKIGKLGAGSLETFLTTDGIRMGGRIDPMYSGGIFNREGGKEKMKGGK